MRATRPPRATVSSLNYRDAEGTPTETAPEIKTLGEAALRLLGRDGAVSAGNNADADRCWHLSTSGPNGIPIAIRCDGPNLPDRIPDTTAHPSTIPYDRPWTGTYRFEVRAPLIVLDLYWRPETPLRIMGFSRGDWENSLLAVAA